MKECTGARAAAALLFVKFHEVMSIAFVWCCILLGVREGGEEGGSGADYDFGGK